MLRLRSSIPDHRADDFSAELAALVGVRRVVGQPEIGGVGTTVIVADVEPSAADPLVEALTALGLEVDDYILEKIDVVAPLHSPHAGGSDGFAWIEVVGQARANSRPLARYLALINVAAVIGALGVISGSSILIVGAMAVSPDLLPICATCVGIVARRRTLAGRAFVTLWLGLLLVIVTAAILTALLNLTNLLPESFQVDQSPLNTFAHLDYSTVLVALAAGIAAMLSFETRASAAVGVAISVTTMPASAYLGVALGGGGTSHALEALAVLVINVVLLLLAGTATLTLQRWLPNRSGAPL